MLGRFKYRMDVKPGSGRAGGKIRRQDSHLDLPRNVQLRLLGRPDRIGVRLGSYQRPDPGFNLKDFKGLGEIVIPPDLESTRFVLHILQRSEKHDGDIAGLFAGAQAAAHLVAIDARHHNIEEHEVGSILFGAAQCALSVQSNTQFVFAAEGLDEHVDVCLDVIDDQDATFGKILHHSSPLLHPLD